MKQVLEARVKELKGMVDNSAAQYNFAVGRMEEAQTALNECIRLEQEALNPLVEPVPEDETPVAE